MSVPDEYEAWERLHEYLQRAGATPEQAGLSGIKVQPMLGMVRLYSPFVQWVGPWEIARRELQRLKANSGPAGVWSSLKDWTAGD